MLGGMSANTEEAPVVDPLRVLESVVTELEVLAADAPIGVGGDLVRLFGALLVFGLDGDPSLIPERSFGLGKRRMLEIRVTRAARRLCAATPPAASPADEQNVNRDEAARRIEDLIHLIDPELRAVA